MPGPISLSLRPEAGSHFEFVETAGRGCTDAKRMAEDANSICAIGHEVATTFAVGMADADGMVIAMSVAPNGNMLEPYMLTEKGASAPTDSAKASKEDTKDASTLSPASMNKMVRYHKSFAI